MHMSDDAQGGKMHTERRRVLAFGVCRGARGARSVRGALPSLQRAVMSAAGVWAWVALATAAAVSHSCPLHPHMCSSVLLPRSALLSLRGGGPAAAAGEQGVNDPDRQMRDSDLVGQRDQAAGRGEPCVDWRAYRPNTEAEQRRESQLAGDGSAPSRARWRCARRCAMSY